MSEKQKPQPAHDKATLDDAPPVTQNDLPPHSYYYDDATGYEIYKPEDDDDEVEDGTDC